MGLINAYSNWKTKRYEKHLTKMQSLGKCPDCNGRGYMTIFDYEYAAPYNCYGCNGSGLYTDWEEKETE
ncbi:DnaJ-class molecular chaperone [Scopulibacillus daqui]|uniref:DnaJ-class molecular chaperone n=1 Tax=Scopulibacillus daqui TaxID=1469162 RepID=A0ABS2PV62_9BACL|nr:methionine aminopeptidase [Scopulibacillus daqui]MBM7643838.1 DnaJ-class molecular chaperone [Scopulibacillus daqui]